MSIINIFILNWNSAESVRECIHNILRLSEKVNIRIIIINNYSTDHDLIKIREIVNKNKDTIEIYLVENKLNLGMPEEIMKVLNFLWQIIFPDIF